VKIRSAVFAITLATPVLALAPRAADAFGTGAATGSFQHMNSGGGNGGHSGGSGHSAGRVGGPSGHGGGSWGGHSGWSGRGAGWGGGWHHHDWDRWRGGWSFGFGYWGPYWDPWLSGWDYPYRYAPSYPVYVVPDAETLPSAPPPPSYWYYCPSARAYYPYVSQCPEAWVPVSPTPPH